MNVLIIGGKGDFGSFYAKLFKKNGFNVFIKDYDENETKKFCEEKGFNFFEEDYSIIDTIIFSVPNKIAPIVIQQTIPKVKNKTLLIDFCSVKSFVVPEFEKIKNNDLELVSIHPMHGPRLSSISGMPVIIIPISIGKKFEIIKEFFLKEKANIIFSTVQEHDKILSIVQGLTHFSQIVSAEIIKESEIDIKKLKEFSSPNFELFINLISRVVLQNPELYSQIQTENPYNNNMRKKFLEKTLLLEDFGKKSDSEKIKQEIIKSAQIFKNSDEILFSSDVAISALKFLQKTLSEHVGKKILVENILNNTFHYGIIEKVNLKELYISEFKNTNKNTTILALNKLRLTTKKEMFDWKKNNLLERHLDYSFLIPKKSDCNKICKIFNNAKIAIFDCIDEFESEKFPENKKSITLKATFFEDECKEEIDSKIIETIELLGFEKR
jgi:prephenate dehydrogenase